MSPDQKIQVQNSFDLLLPVWEEAAGLFYRRLFELDPALRPMFKVPIEQQALKSLNMLRIAVYGLDHMDQLEPALYRLGVRHYEYGVRAEQFATVETALLWTLEHGLEGSCTPEMLQAWQALFAMMSGAMLKGSACLQHQD